MKVQGEFSLPLPRQRAWDLLLNTEVLAHVMPGCESLVPAGPGEYEMKLKFAMASMSGLFAGKIRIEEQNPPVSYRLVVDGQGRIGIIHGSGTLTLNEEGEATKISYIGEVQVSGLIASVGERLLDMTTKSMLKRFFEALSREARAAGHPDNPQSQA